SASYDSGVVEIAALRFIHGVTQHAAELSFTKDQFIRFRRIGGSDYKKLTIQMSRGKRTGFPCERTCPRPLRHSLCCAESDNPHLCARVQQPGDLRLAYR